MILKKSADEKKAWKITTQGGKELTVYTRITYLSYTHVWSHP